MILLKSIILAFLFFFFSFVFFSSSLLLYCCYAMSTFLYWHTHIHAYIYSSFVLSFLLSVLELAYFAFALYMLSVLVECSSSSLSYLRLHRGIISAYIAFYTTYLLDLIDLMRATCLVLYSASSRSGERKEERESSSLFPSSDIKCQFPNFDIHRACPHSDTTTTFTIHISFSRTFKSIK